MKKLSLLIAAVIAAGMLSSCGKDNKSEEIAVPIYETKEVNYRTVKAEITDISEKYYQTGSYSYPYYEFVSFKVSGQIESVKVESGQEVKKGELLCTLFTDEVTEKIEEKEIYLNQAKKTLETLQSKNSSANEIEDAKIDLEIQQLEYDKLVGSLEDYKVYAPCDGVFMLYEGRGEDNKHSGELNAYSQVNQGQIFGYATDKSQQYLCCEVYDNPLNNVNFGTKVKIEQGANSCSGVVTDIIYNENGEYSSYVYVVTPDDGNNLFDFGDVQIIFDVYSRLDTVVVPQKAVKTVGERTFVNLLIDGVKVEQDVELGINDGENVEIVSGLSGVEELILN